jgi:hypothetical protein
MHVGDRVENKANGARGRVAALPPNTPPGSIAVHQNDDTTAVWALGDAVIVKAIADVIAGQEKLVQANAAAAQQAPTEENLATLESAVAQLRQFKREARGVFRVE